MTDIEKGAGRPVERVERDFPSYPIGMIQFGENRTAFISANDRGIVRSTSSPTQAEASGFAELHIGRVLDLKKYNEVQVVRVQPGEFDIATYPTIESNRDPLYVRMQYHDATTSTRGTHGLDEINMLEVLTGKKGGIAVFHGGDMPSEIALVMEKEKGDDTKSAIVAFFHHEGVVDHQIGLDSVAGAGAFFQLLNDELAASPTPLQDAVRRKLAKGFRKNKIKDSPVRRELLEAVLLAHARLWDLTGDEEHWEFIDRYMPDGIFGRSLEELDTEGEVNDVLNTFIVGRGIQSVEPFKGTVGNASAEGEERDIELNTDEAKRIYDFYHGQLGDDFGAEINYGTSELVESLMEGYLREVIHLAKNGDSSDVFGDLSAMLDELRSTRYANSDMGLTETVRLKVREMGRLEGYASTHPRMWHLINGLIKYAEKKQAETLIRENRGWNKDE